MKNILIVGASKGIGSAAASILLQKGNQLWLTARDAQSITLSAFNKQSFDVQTGSEIQLPEVLDGIIYAPGTINLKPFHRLSDADFLLDWQINVNGFIKVVQAALPNLKRANNASVIAFSSVAAKIGMPFHASIGSAKGALEGLTRSLAAEYAPKIRFNVIAPSLTATPLAEKLINTPEKLENSQKRHPLQRIGSAYDQANLACFLLSDEASFITGQVFGVDGGLSSLKV
jgi:NAD(P)-dependent dehydrogenase (short-subunit alcohol dehydrogenase family)